MFTEKITVLYRGSLKSCNYRCGYCPFSKHRGTAREYERDREQWLRFVESLGGRREGEAGSGEAFGAGNPPGSGLPVGAVDPPGSGLPVEAVNPPGSGLPAGAVNRPEEGLSVGAVMVAPYGEALIHGWYWQGLGLLSSMDNLDCVGAQTNLSFSAEESLAQYRMAGGRTEKLRLWATFHPEMTSPGSFAQKCRQILKEGVEICAGAVGVPENLEIIRCLRMELPEEIYLWINKMDGLGRSYTEEETKNFQEIDPFFGRELEMAEADERQCQNRIFVEADGKVRRCNISRTLGKGWYERSGGAALRQMLSAQERCGRKLCSCYLAYGGRQDVMNHIFFGAYPLFRIPRKVRAAFLDIQGTLIPRGQKEVSRFARSDLELAARMGIKLFFATTLPVEEARKRCRPVWQLFSGGVFLGGGHVILGEEREMICPLDRRWIPVLRQEAGKFGARMLAYERGGQVCKLTLLRPGHRPWKEEEIQEVSESCRKYAHGKCTGDGIRLFSEDACLQAVAPKTSKAEGAKTLCKWLGICPQEAAAAGDSEEDQEMMALCGPKGAGAGGGRRIQVVLPEDESSPGPSSPDLASLVPSSSGPLSPNRLMSTRYP